MKLTNLTLLEQRHQSLSIHLGANKYRKERKEKGTGQIVKREERREVEGKDWTTEKPKKFAEARAFRKGEGEGKVGQRKKGGGEKK